MIFEVNH